MKLQAEDRQRAVPDGGQRAGGRLGEREEVCRDLVDLVAVAHPHLGVPRDAGEDRVALNELSSKNEIVPANYVAPKGPGNNWTIDEVVALTKGGLKGRNYENGKAMFTSVSCVACHHFMGDGGNIGPDISGAGSRYSIRDLMENIIEPSKVISDQYESHQIEKSDGSMVIGRIVSEDADNVQVMMNPFSPTTLSPIKKSEIKSKKTYPISMMPPGMINVLNQDELLDLIA
jgi:putative heme-binding domain-containing protein